MHHIKVPEPKEIWLVPDWGHSLILKSIPLPSPNVLSLYMLTDNRKAVRILISHIKLLEDWKFIRKASDQEWILGLNLTMNQSW